MILLDCTLRDGGYYNDWDFDEDLVQDYLIVADALKLDFIEIGFRTTVSNKFLGAYAYSSDEHLSAINIPKGLKDKIGVMINGAEIISESKIEQKQILDRLFKPKSKSPVSLVRIACHKEEILKCLSAVNYLKNLGYKVGLNLMQISEITLKEIIDILQSLKNIPLDVFYIADSLGSLDENQISQVIKTIKREWDGEIGVHTHDNMGNAINNTIKAWKLGATWLDSTITGMGRGPGNAQTEFALASYAEDRLKSGSYIKLLDLINKHFNKLRGKYKWGTNPYYFLAGKYSIHPTYIQKMQEDSRYKSSDIMAVLELLKNIDARKFDSNN